MKYFLFSISFLSAIYCFSQKLNPGGVKSPIFWKNQFQSNQRSNQTINIFNYHPYVDYSNTLLSNHLETNGLNKISLFAVFSDQSTDKFIHIENGNKSVYVSDTSVMSDRIIAYKSKRQFPKIISYIDYLGEKDSQSKNIDLLIGKSANNTSEVSGTIAELVLYDRLINTLQRKKIESYLSIKYGISLQDSSIYYNSSGDEIFNCTSQKPFNHSVTAIGRDDQSQLFQKQSINCCDDSYVSIGLNKIEKSNDVNKSSIKNQNFLFWAHDDKALSFITQTSGISILERSWKLTAFGHALSGKQIEIAIDPSMMVNYNPSKQLILSLQNNASRSNLISIPMEKDESGIFTCIISFDQDHSGFDFFTFLQKDEVITAKDIQKTNEKTTKKDVIFDINPNPFKANNKFLATIKNLPKGEYEIQLIDVNGNLLEKEKRQVENDLVYSSTISVAGNYFLNVSGKFYKNSFPIICID